jgi:hypothetical protein
MPEPTDRRKETVEFVKGEEGCKMEGLAYVVILFRAEDAA